MNNYIFTSESVSDGHPDKVADQISDALVDAGLEKGDETTRVAIETLVTTNHVTVAGEVKNFNLTDATVERIIHPNIVLLAGGLFIISSISDYFDGYLARVLNQSSKLGTLLDPIADKLLIASVIVVLVDTNVISNLHVIPAIIILLREIAISGLREFLAKMNTDMPVSKLAKYKTTFQMVSLSILIISLGFQLNDFLWNLGLVTLWIAAIITLLSGYNYMAKGLKHI